MSFKNYLEKNYKGPYMATDIIIRYGGGIVIIDRKWEPLGLALPGGIAEDITFEENAIKEAKEETGLDITLDSPEKPLCTLSTPDQDPRAFIAVVVYTATGKGVLKPDPKEDAKSAQVIKFEDIEDWLKKDDWAYEHHKKAIGYFLKARNLTKD